ncbi:MAG: hypothetical protein ACREX0_01095, partial [Noviherbaspirillum sp.]
APTPIGCYLLKNLLRRRSLSLRNSLSNRFVRQQQRNEIMQRFFDYVNQSFDLSLIYFAA